MSQTLFHQALLEDAYTNDVTTTAMVSNGLVSSAHILSKADGVFFGRDVVSDIFEIVDGSVDITFHVADGDRVTAGQRLIDFSGEASSLLRGERVMLNFLQRLSGVATVTQRYVDALNDSSVSVLDTRKTTPLFRELERAAVVAGGGVNHRYNLADMVLIKENHLSAFFMDHSPADLPGLFRQFREKTPGIKIEIEIETLAQLRDYDLSDVDYIMFDNFSLADIKAGVDLCRSNGYRAEIEVSGNVSLDTIGQYAGLGIDRISVGSLTHSVVALDLSLIFD